MTMTLREIMDTCDSWDRFCDLHGFSEWAVNEGGGGVQVTLSTHQAHHLGIVKLPDWRQKPFDEVYPANDKAQGCEASPEASCSERPDIEKDL